MQETSALAEARRAGIDVEVLFAPAFDHLLVIRRRMSVAGAAPVDAVVVEPGSVAFTHLLLKELKGAAASCCSTTWVPEIEDYGKTWGAGLPFGTISTHHARVGEIQGQQISALLPQGGQVLCITGPQRSSAALDRMLGLRSAVKPGVMLSETSGAPGPKPTG